MAPRLRNHALAGIDQHHREIGVGGAGRHVAGILRMPWCVGNDEAAQLGGKEAVGDVNRDALLTLRLQAVDQQREIEIAAGGANRPALGRQRVELIVEQRLGIVEQPADQRALAVVDAAASDETQGRAIILIQPRRIGGGDRGSLVIGHQK